MKRILGDRYQLGAMIGTGGMADVYVAEDQRLHREVAVKILRSDLARDPSFVTRFNKEALAVAALNHPGIVSVYDSGKEDSPSGAMPYIVMEYVEGKTLREIAHKGERFPLQRAVEIVMPQPFFFAGHSTTRRGVHMHDAMRIGPSRVDGTVNHKARPVDGLVTAVEHLPIHIDRHQVFGGHLTVVSSEMIDEIAMFLARLLGQSNRDVIEDQFSPPHPVKQAIAICEINSHLMFNFVHF